MRCFVSGGAGFVGSHLVDRLVADGHAVTVYDNLSVGREAFLRGHFDRANFAFVKADLLDVAALEQAMAGSEVVFHLAANSDIVRGANAPSIDLEQGTVATFNLLEAMRRQGARKIVFASSSAIYGEVEALPIGEDFGPLFPISFYGASKLACEALISAYCHNFGFAAWILRFGNVTGPRATHGVTLDLYRKLQRDSTELEVLGDGNQAKSYVEVRDVVDGMLHAFARAPDAVNYLNLATEGLTSVRFIAREVLAVLGLADTTVRFTGGVRGWPGDVPRVVLDVSKLRALGWMPRYPNSDDACRAGIRATIDEIRARAR